MTQSENERLAVVESQLGGVREDLGEIKTLCSQIVEAQQTAAQRGNERHADLGARIAVLEDRSARLEKLVYGASGVAGLAIGGHIPQAVGAVQAVVGS